MKKLMLAVLSSFVVVIAHSEDVLSTGVLREITCTVTGVSHNVVLEKCFLRDRLPRDVGIEEDDGSFRVLQETMPNAIRDKHFGHYCGKYALVLSSGLQGEKKLLGIHYYEWYGVPAATGPLVPYTALFWNQQEECFYWVIVSRRIASGLCDADILIEKASLLTSFGATYPAFIDMPMKEWPQPREPMAKYEYKSASNEPGYIPQWFWSKIDFDYDGKKNVLKILFIDSGLDGGTMTISYDISKNTWCRSFAPSQMRLLREASRKKDKQRLRQDGMGEIHKDDESGR